MFNPGSEDVIVALGTPYGTGAIAVVRMSGAEAFDVLQKVFKPAKKDLNWSSVRSHSMIYGEILDGDEPLDEVLVAVYRQPHSYTGENSVEINCHASPYIQSRLVQVLIDHGARQAEPGEFSLRAFLNAKMDLSRTEAVAELINARSEAARKLAYKQLKGGVSRKLHTLRESLLNFISLIELELDFTEEDVEFADRGELKELLEDILSQVKHLYETFRMGNAVKNGILTVIAGKPNAGKSTLLNALLKENRAIVTDIPGTTRDSIEEIIHWKGVEFRLVDTAGLRESEDEVEKIGIRKTGEYLQKADVILYLVDAAQTTAAELKDEIARLPEEVPVLLIINKTDLLPPEHRIEFDVGDMPRTIRTLHLSLKEEQNPELSIMPELVDMLALKDLFAGSLMITNARHYEALRMAEPALVQALEGLDSRLSGDLLAVHIREALYYLGSITGNISDDDILGNIFSQFCIGK